MATTATWHIHTLLALLKVGAAWIHDKEAEDMTLADLLVKQDIDKAPMTINGQKFGFSNLAVFPFDSRGDAKKGLPGVKINGVPVGHISLDTKVADMLVTVEGSGFAFALVQAGKKFRTVVVV